LRRILFHSAAFSLVDQAVVSATSFLTGIIIARACAKDQFGLYMLGFGLVNLLVSLQTALISAPYTVYSPRLSGQALRRYLGSTTLHQLVFSALVMLTLALPVTICRAMGSASAMRNMFWAIALSIAFLLLREHLRRVYFAGLRIGAALVFDVCVSLAQLSAVAALARCGALSCVTVYGAMGAVCALAASGWLWHNRHEVAFRGSRPMEDLARNWSQAKWVLAGSIVVMVMVQLPLWFLTGLDGPAATGTFSAAMSVVCLSNPFIIGIGNYLGPQISAAFALNGIEGVYSVVTKSTALLAAAMMVFCLVLFSCAHPLVVLMYGGKYAGSGVVVPVLALGFLAWASNIPMGCGLQAIERAQVNLVANLVGLVFALVPGFWLVSLYGPIGGAYGFLLGHLVSLVVRWIGFARVVKSMSRWAAANE
jgi:O-antigen/teichoic acid export membrane protein